MTTAREVLLKLHELKPEHIEFESLWQEIADYMRPNRQDFTRIYGIGENRRQFIFDNTAEHSLELFASSVIGFIANPATEWFSLSTTDEEINNDPEAREWLEEAGKYVLNAFNEPVANFYAHLFNVLADIAAFGTSGLHVQVGAKSMVNFEVLNLSKTYIARGIDDRIDTILREIEMTGHQLMQMKDERGWELSDDLTKEINQDASKKYNIVHLIQPRKGFVPGRIGPENMEFESIYVDEKNKSILFESGFEENPIAVAGWERHFEETYFRGPGTKALPSVKTLNQMAKAHILAAEKTINPPLVIPDDGSFGQIDLSAGSINIGNGQIAPIESHGNLPLSLEMQEALRNEVRMMFFVDQLQLVGDAQMTATEVLQRQDERGRLLAPSIGRLQSGLIGPTVERVFGILSRNGTIPPAPAILLNREVRVIYESPLSRAQRSNDAAAIVQFIETMGGVAQVKPEVLDRINADEIVQELHDIGGVPEKILVPLEEAQQVRQQRQQLQQVQESAMVAQEAAQAAKTASEAGVL